MAGGGYLGLLRMPGVLRLSLAGLVARLPASMTGIAEILLLHSRHLGYAAAGAVVAAFGLASALTGPLTGRAVDVFGGRRVIPVLSLAQAACLLALVPAASAGLGASAVVAAAAGLLSPPNFAVMRSQWSGLPERDNLRARAQALESVVLEAVFLLGPLLVSLAVAVASAGFALDLAAAADVVGGLVLATSPTLRRPSGDPRGSAGVAGRVALVLGAAFAVQVLGFAMVEVSVTASAANAGRPGLAGAILALWAVGSASGGLAWGAAHRGPPRWQQVAVLSAVAGALIALLAISASPVPLLWVALPAGLAIAPASTVLNGLVLRMVPPARHTEMLGWVGAAASMGVSAGYAVGGWTVGAAGTQLAVLGAAAVVVVTGVGVGLARPGRLTEADSAVDGGR